MRRSSLLLLLLILPFGCLAAACDDDRGEQAGVPPVAATATPSAIPGTPPPATATPISTPGRVDGTIAPQNFGATDPVTVKANPDPLTGSALLRAVRLGVHPEEGGWDRIVFEFGETLPPGSIAYVPSIAACGSGAPLSVAGSAILLVRFSQSSAHTEAGQPTVPRNLTGAGSTLLESRVSCDFEGVVEWAIGVKEKQRFKVTVLSRPFRVMIDIKQ